MNTMIVNATEFSRGLSEFLNQVQYTGQVLDIERGKRVVARLSPVPRVPPVPSVLPVPSVSVSNGFPIAQLADLLAKGALLAAERKRMAKDLAAVRSRLVAKADPWV